MTKLKKRTLKQEYMQCFNYIKSSKNFIYSAISIFLFFSLFGFFIEPTSEITEKVFSLLREIMEKFEGKNLIQTFWLIFTNNTAASFMVLATGLFFGILPILILVSNGYVIGFVSKLATETEGLLILWRLLPHGIFELPAILISAGLGIRLGFELFKKKKLKENSLSSIKTFLLVILPLLFIAALIESLLIFFVK